jgi:hypothetical protein
MKTLGDLLKQLKLGSPKLFQPSITVCPKEKRICVILEDVSYYSEWIKDEDGDIGIYRAMDDKRVVGAFLPLRIWTGDLPVSII